ncbi:MAG: ATP-binding protein [candidate division WOR-3 bacterium]
MKQKGLLIVAISSLFVVILSFLISYSYLRRSIDRVVMKDVETIKDVLYASLKASIQTIKEQEFFVVKNLLRAQEWLSSHPDFSERNFKWITDLTDISGITLLDESGKVTSYYPQKLQVDSLTLGFSIKTLSEQDPYPYENDYSVNLASKIGGRIVIFSVVKDEVFGERIAGGIGSLLRALEGDEKIFFVALQDTQGIWFGVKVPDNISDIDEDEDLIRVLRKGKTFSRVLNYDDSDVLEISMPFMIEDVFEGILRMGISRGYYASLYRGIVRNLLLLHLLIYALIILVFSFVFSSKALRLKLSTFDTLADHVGLGIALFGKNDVIIYWNKAFRNLLKLPDEMIKKLEMGDFLQGLPVLEVGYKKDVIRKLRFTAVPIIGKKYKREATLVLVESTELEDKLERAEQIELLGEMAAQVAHEIKNPLNSISMIIQRFASEFNITPQMESKEMLSILEKEVNRIKDSVNRFYSILAPIHLKWECTEVCQLVEEILAEFLPELKLKNINFRTYYRACPQVMLDREKIKEAIRNIVKNAIEAIEQDGELKVTISLMGENLLIAIGDNGKGISKEELQKLGLPFYTTKSKGSGMGLFYVRKVIESHGGNIIIKSKKGFGTVVALSLPYAKDRRC